MTFLLDHNIGLVAVPLHHSMSSSHHTQLTSRLPTYFLIITTHHEPAPSDYNEDLAFLSRRLHSRLAAANDGVSRHVSCLETSRHKFLPRNTRITKGGIAIVSHPPVCLYACLSVRMTMTLMYRRRIGWVRLIARISVVSSLLGALKRGKMGPRLLLMTNRKSHTRFPLVTKSTTLYDLEQPLSIHSTL